MGVWRSYVLAYVSTHLSIWLHMWTVLSALFSDISLFYFKTDFRATAGSENILSRCSRRILLDPSCLLHQASNSDIRN